MQGQARLSEVCSAWAEQVQEANAALRELVCRRFRWVSGPLSMLVSDRVPAAA